MEILEKFGYATLILKGWFKHPLSLATCIALGIPLNYDK
jgi:hypothetical protein